MISRLGSVGIGAFLVVLAMGLEKTASAEHINFEGFAELTQISEQYCVDLGVEFSVIGNPNTRPIIALEDCPIRAYDGGSQCSQHDTPLVSNGGVAALADPLVGGMGVLNYAVGQSIAMTFHPPINTIQLHVIDIDNQDVVTVRAWNGLSLVMEVTRAFGDPNTGNRVATPFDLVGDTITRVEVLVPSVIGYAIDDITFTRPVCPMGDVNGDCQLDAADVSFLVGVLLGEDVNCAHVAAADFNGSGTADGQDIQPFLDHLVGA